MISLLSLNNIEIVLTTIISIFFGYMLFLAVKSFLKPRWTHPFVSFIIICLLFSCANIVVYPEELTGTTSFFLCFILILMVFFKNEWYLKLSTAILIFPAIVAINYILQDMGSLIWQHVYDKQMSQVGQTVLHTLTLALRVPLWYGIYRLIKN